MEQTYNQTPDVIAVLYKEISGEFCKPQDNKVYASVSWGDWKHDHLFLKEIMFNRGYSIENEHVTEEDGSDAYSADYVFVKDINDRVPDRKRFVVGDKKSYASLYGGTIGVEITEVTDDTVTYKESWIAEDTGERVVSSTYTHPILYDTELYGDERIEMWEYNGTHCYIYAGKEE